MCLYYNIATWQCAVLQQGTGCCRPALWWPAAELILQRALTAPPFPPLPPG